MHGWEANIKAHECKYAWRRARCPDWWNTVAGPPVLVRSGGSRHGAASKEAIGAWKEANWRHEGVQEVAGGPYGRTRQLPDRQN